MTFHSCSNPRLFWGLKILRHGLQKKPPFNSKSNKFFSFYKLDIWTNLRIHEQASWKCPSSLHGRVLATVFFSIWTDVERKELENQVQPHGRCRLFRSRADEPFLGPTLWLSLMPPYAPPSISLLRKSFVSSSIPINPRKCTIPPAKVSRLSFTHSLSLLMGVFFVLRWYTSSVKRVGPFSWNYMLENTGS